LPEDISLSPNFDNATNLVLNVGTGALVCDGSTFGNDGIECLEKLVLLADFCLLGDLYSRSVLGLVGLVQILTICKVDERDPLVRRCFFQTLLPQRSNFLGLSPGVMVSFMSYLQFD
jgi:hypothetical protein